MYFFGPLIERLPWICLISAEFGLKKVADELFELCHRDVKSIRACANCFEYWINDSDDYFTKVCDKPHMLVYAKLDRFPYWPAKVMSIHGNVADVEFFGDHTQADIPMANCYLYSKQYPGKSKNDKSLGEAQKVQF